MPDEYDEQRLPQVAQLKAERANAEAYGNGPLVERIDRQLAAWRRRRAAEERAPTPAAARAETPAGRHAGRTRVTATSEETN